MTSGKDDGKWEEWENNDDDDDNDKTKMLALGKLGVDGKNVSELWTLN